MPTDRAVMGYCGYTTFNALVDIDHLRPPTKAALLPSNEPNARRDWAIFFCALVAAQIQPLIANPAMMLPDRQDRHGQSPGRFFGDGANERDRARGINSLAVFIVVGITYPRPIFAAAKCGPHIGAALAAGLADKPRLDIGSRQGSRDQLVVRVEE